MKYLMFIAAFFLMSCERYCPQDPQLGFYQRSSASFVDANDAYKDTGLIVNTGEEYRLIVEGSVELCPDTFSITPDSGNFSPSPFNNAWQVAPFLLGERSITLKISGSYRDGTKTNTSGQGLYIYISETEIDPDLNPDISLYSPLLNDDHTIFGGGQPGELIEFFKASNGENTLSLDFPEEAFVYFRYALNSDHRNARNNVPEPYNPWAIQEPNEDLCELCEDIGTLSYPDNPCVDLGYNSLKCIVADPAVDATSAISLNVSGVSGGYSITGDYSCTFNAGEQLSVSIDAGSSYGDSTWTIYNDDNNYEGVEIDKNGTMMDYVSAGSSGTLKLSIDDVFQKPGDIIAPDGCVGGGGCCVKKEFPDVTVFPGDIDSGGSCGSIAGLAVCADDASCGMMQGYSGHRDNLGRYNVTLIIRKEMVINRFLDAVILPVRGIIFGYCPDGSVADYTMDCFAGGTVTTGKQGVMQSIYNTFVADPGYARLIFLLVQLSVIIIAYSLISGSIDKPFKTTALHTIRIGIVLILLQPDSWFVLNQYLFSVAFGLTDYIMLMMQESVINNIFEAMVEHNAVDAPGYDSTDIRQESIFDFFYYIYYFIFTSENMMILFQSLLSYKFFGLIYVGLVMLVSFYLFMMVLRLLSIYLVSRFYIALLVILAPLYIIFLLFNNTRLASINWMKLMLNYSLQPAAAFIPVIIASIIFFSFFYQHVIGNNHSECVLGLGHFISMMFYTIDIALNSTIHDALSNFLCLWHLCVPDLQPDQFMGVMFALATVMYVIHVGVAIMDWLTRLMGSVIVSAGESSLAGSFGVVKGFEQIPGNAYKKMKEKAMSK